MKKEELIEALRALAKKHPNAVHVGYMWKNPLNPRSIGRRWTPADLKLFRKFQFEYKQVTVLCFKTLRTTLDKFIFSSTYRIRLNAFSYFSHRNFQLFLDFGIR